MADRVNTFKNKSEAKESIPEPEVVATPQKRKQKQKPEEEQPKETENPSRFAFLNRWFDIAKDERTVKITGLLILLSSVYLLFAFTSYLFSWKQDQDKMYLTWLELIANNQIPIDNWLGKTGAFVSNLFIHRWLGVSSFLLVPFLFIVGLRLFLKITLFPVRKAFNYTLFFGLWISLLCGFAFSSNAFIPGGAIGFHLNQWISSVMGGLGTGLILFFSLMTYIIVVFNPSFTLPKRPEPIIEPEPTLEKNNENVYRGTVEELDITNKRNEIEFDEPFIKDKEEVKQEIPLELEVTVLEEEKIVEAIDAPEEDKKAEPELEIVNLDALKGDNIANVVAVKLEEERKAAMAKGSALEEFGEYDPRLDLGSYEFPSVELLNPYGGDKSIEINKEELNDNKNRIIKTLNDYGITISSIKASVGPTVTLYEIVPDAGIRISKIKNLEDDIALSLAALGIRIIAPMPGKGTIGIEVPNSKPDIVPMRYILDSEKFKNCNFELPIALGKTILNETFVTDLAKMPHLLMAGATGQGKSVGLNAVLASLLYKKHPSELKFVLVDPKKVELTLFNKIERHYLAKLPDTEEAIITDTKKVVHTLNSLCIEMDNRYELLKHAQVRNIKEYNAKFISRKLLPTDGHRFLPYIVLVVDEFADLIMTAGKEVETPIARLAQLARAIGIHLIIATQRPSVNIITIKANFPARIAFRVTSKIDSRTILDAGGAEQLIGRGDMLLSTGNDLTRIQCAFIDTPEVEQVCDFIGAQRAYPKAYELPEYVDENGEGSKKEDIDPSERDQFFAEAAHLVVQTQQGSSLLIQRKMKLGYNRAGRIIDQLEAAGIVGPFEGSKARQVLIKTEADLEQFLRNPQS